MIINNRSFPMWEEFVKKKNNFIGGVLEDFGDMFDQMLKGEKYLETKIIDIVLKPNGNDSAYFLVMGKDFDCGFDVKYGRIIPGEKGWVSFSGYGSHIWRIKPIIW